MGRTLHRLFRAARRAFPACSTQAQAVAFNMFVAFFPALLFGLGLLSILPSQEIAGRGIPDTVQLVLPTGVYELIASFLTRRGQHPLSWLVLGLGGTLIAGSQVMVTLIEGVRLMEGEKAPLGYMRRQMRALFLLLITIVPWNAVVLLTVFGRQVRGRLIRRFGWPLLVRTLGAAGFICCVMSLGFGVLIVVYRNSLSHRREWKMLAPGAFLSTALWWVLDASLGLYFIHVPYRLIYGELAAAIGLLIWMYLTAIVIFLGAAYNAVTAEDETAAISAA